MTSRTIITTWTGVLSMPDTLPWGRGFLSDASASWACSSSCGIRAESLFQKMEASTAACWCSRATGRSAWATTRGSPSLRRRTSSCWRRLGFRESVLLGTVSLLPGGRSGGGGVGEGEGDQRGDRTCLERKRPRATSAGSLGRKACREGDGGGGGAGGGGTITGCHSLPPARAWRRSAQRSRKASEASKGFQSSCSTVEATLRLRRASLAG